MPYPAGSAVADVPADLQALANQIAAQTGLFTSGTLAARPTPVAADVDRYYYATDNGFLYRWSGAAWAIVNPTDAVAGTGSMRTLGTGAQQAAPGNDSRFITSGTFASRPAAGVANRTYRATDTKMTYMDTGTEWIPAGVISVPDTAILAYNAAWPASPVDGQETYRWADAAHTALWRFKYFAAGAAGFRWMFVGGPPLHLIGGAVSNASVAGTVWYKSAVTWAVGIAGYFDIEYILTSINSSGDCYVNFAFSTLATATTASALAIDTLTHVNAPDVGGPSDNDFMKIEKDMTAYNGLTANLYAKDFGGVQGWSMNVDLFATPTRNG